MVRLDHIKVVDQLPVGLNFVSANLSGSASGQTVSWLDIGSLEPGKSTYLDLVAHINGQAYGELVNLINATGQPLTGNNVTSESTRMSQPKQHPFRYPRRLRQVQVHRALTSISP